MSAVLPATSEFGGGASPEDSHRGLLACVLSVPRQAVMQGGGVNVQLAGMPFSLKFVYRLSSLNMAVSTILVLVL